MNPIKKNYFLNRKLNQGPSCEKQNNIKTTKMHLIHCMFFSTKYVAFHNICHLFYTHFEAWKSLKGATLWWQFHTSALWIQFFCILLMSLAEFLSEKHWLCSVKDSCFVFFLLQRFLFFCFSKILVPKIKPCFRLLDKLPPCFSTRLGTVDVRQRARCRELLAPTIGWSSPCLRLLWFPSF